jgi:hypothetical protein
MKEPNLPCLCLFDLLTRTCVWMCFRWILEDCEGNSFFSWKRNHFNLQQQEKLSLSATEFSMNLKKSPRWRGHVDSKALKFRSEKTTSSTHFSEYFTRNVRRNFVCEHVFHHQRSPHFHSINFFRDFPSPPGQTFSQIFRWLLEVFFSASLRR